ncbi:TRAP transporter small permease [Martelella radicis]|uniref:TRAP transporter small permease protein n=1 Tax=Martelella radicis TaxID=1397476 RepID=A0A7W6PC04_9HYPH|nr:TRAP transporter small permease subunit [Martelella radicis]MBB4124016.1 TRAP-type C4-dicarboxylate transport system permease small subunit [Martelella radicis]
MLKRIEYACAALLLTGIVLLVGGGAAARSLGWPIIWSVEIAQLMFLWLCVLAIDLGMQEDRHFGLALVLDNVSPLARKLIEAANIVILIGLSAFFLYYAWKNMILMHRRLDGALQLPGSLFYAPMVLGFGLLVRTLAVKLIATLRQRP